MEWFDAAIVIGRPPVQIEKFILAIMLGGMVAVSAFLPMRLHPMFFTLSLLAMLFALSRAIANYHVIR